MKLIKLSERDVSSLEKLRQYVTVSNKNQPDNYRNRVVVKPWGYEFLIFQNEFVAIWFLHIDKGQATSMHCHPSKKTSLIVLSGQALCNTFYNRNYLNGTDSIVIEKGVFHSTQSLSAEGIDILEIEAPPDKTDLIRLNDQYGRQAEGYEGLSEMKSDSLERYGYFYFDTPESGQSFSFENERYEISIAACDANATFQEHLSTKKGEFFCSCQGQVVDNTGSAIIDVGDSTEGVFFGTFEGLSIKGPATFLKARSL